MLNPWWLLVFKNDHDRKIHKVPNWREMINEQLPELGEKKMPELHNQNMKKLPPPDLQAILNTRVLTQY